MMPTKDDGKYNQSTPSLNPPNFPIHWKNSDDQLLPWQQMRFHYAEPVTPLDYSIILKTTLGFNVASRFYEMPFNRRNQYLNNYVYQAMLPWTRTSEDYTKQVQLCLTKLEMAIGNLEELWDKEWLPAVKEHLAFWEAFDLANAPMAALIDHVEQSILHFEHLWEIHFLVGFPMLFSISFFDDLYQDIFGKNSGGNIENNHPLNAFKLLEGFKTKTLESSELLWILSRKALTIPHVRQILEENAAIDVIPKLKDSVVGQAFLIELYDYLQEYGRQGDKSTLNCPSWMEEPLPVIKNLKDYMTQPERDLLAELSNLAVQRDKGILEARQQLKGYPKPVVERFEFLLKAAQVGYVLREDHGYWIDYAGNYHLRQLFLEVGRRLTKLKAVNEPEDIFYFSLEEIQEMLRNESYDNHSGRVAERKSTLASYYGINPPMEVGTAPSGPPPSDPISQAITLKFMGGSPAVSSDPNTIHGNAGAMGTVRAKAKIIRSLADAYKLQPGDILVTETTAPPWTPLFASAAAVVTDAGGVLSHCAVVAREFGIPAVVGTGIATSVIHDGQLLEVDGGQGIVQILPT